MNVYLKIKHAELTRDVRCEMYEVGGTLLMRSSVEFVLEAVKKRGYTIVDEPLYEIRLCEQEGMYLRPDVLYRLTVDEACPKCRAIADKYRFQPS
jgi:hypothetical protein